MGKLNIKKDKNFFRLLTSYLFILLITIIIGRFANNQAIKLARESVEKVNLAMLEQTKDIVDRRMEEINSIIVQMSWNKYIEEVSNIKLPLTGEDYYRLRETWRSIRNTHLSNTLIETFYVYFKNSDVIISPDACYTRLSSCYEHFFQYDGLKYASWYNEMLNTYNNKTVLPVKNVMIKGSKQPVITYLQSIPIETYTEFYGTIMVLIDEGELLKHLQQFNMGDNGWVYIANNTGEIITGIAGKNAAIAPIDFDTNTLDTDNEYNMFGSSFTVFRSISSYNGWIYTSVIPKNIIMEKVDNVNTITWVISLLSLLLGMGIALFYTEWNIKPVYGISERLKRSKLGINYDHVCELDFG